MDPSESFRKETSGWWHRLDRLVEEARRRPAHERNAFLEQACALEPDLRAEAASLLEHTATGDVFLSSLAAALWSDGESDTHDLFAGRVLGRYRIEARVGSGGMGIVYRAHDTQLDRPVALKFIWPGLNRDPVAKQRLLVEARAAAALDHPNICTVYEAGETADGALFIAMAYYDGVTLLERLAAGPLPIDEAAGVVLQIAEGAAAAHARGIVHRDIKPGNVIITPTGAAKLLDFGVAKNVESSITGPHAALGTTAYMAPEQFDGGPFDARSDVWSLGVVLHESLTAQRPFGAEGSTFAGTLRAVLYDEPPPLRALRPDVPPAVEAVVRRALSRDPAQRQQTAREFAAELDAAVRGGRIAAGAQAPTSALSGRALASVLLLTVVSGVFAWRTGASRLRGELPLAFASVAHEGVADDNPVPSIAVVAFEDPDRAEQPWFADGIADEIRRELLRSGAVRVVGDLASLAFHGEPGDAKRIGSALGVQHLIAGDVRRNADSIWITARLLETAAGATVWNETYGRPLSAAQLQDIQARIADDVVDVFALRSRTAPERSRIVPDDSAYEIYMEGRYHLRRVQAGLSRNAREDLLGSASYFQQVVQRSPQWAPGWAALGEAEYWVGTMGIEMAARFRASKAALKRALALDPTHAQATASLGYVLSFWELDFETAEAHFRRAVEIDPDQFWHCGYSNFLLTAGRYEDAIRSFRRAEAKDPLYIVIKEQLASSYLCANRLEEAVAQAEMVLSTRPGSTLARRDLVLALERLGRFDEAVARLDEVPDTLKYWQLLRALVYAKEGRTEEARTLIRRFDDPVLAKWTIDFWQPRWVSAVALHAAALVALGESDTAIRVLQRAMEQDPRVLLYDRCYPELQALSPDPRYQQLIQRLGIPTRPA